MTALCAVLRTFTKDRLKNRCGIWSKMMNAELLNVSCLFKPAMQIQHFKGSEQEGYLVLRRTSTYAKFSF